MQNICENLTVIRKKIAAAESEYTRRSGSVTLVVASKTRSVAEVKAAIDCDQRHFGENYLQDALPKIQAFPSYIDNKPTGIVWHFIGPIQSNKTKVIAENFVWVESIDRIKIAKRLNDQRPAVLPPLNVCVEVNLSGEQSKSGVRVDEVLSFAQEIIAMPRLKLRGLMSIPYPDDDFQQQRQVFQKLANTLQQLNDEYGYQLDTLSMGMSNDYIAAIAEGSTIVRIGTAIFGARG